MTRKKKTVDVDCSSGFSYDSRGRLTRDMTRGIAGVSYNHLDLPVAVTLSNGNSALFTYSGDGEKLRAQYTVTDMSLYGGGSAPPQAALVTTRVDYRGDVRSVIAEDGRVEEWTDYYPYGMAFYNPSASVQPWKHSGKEHESRLGLHWLYFGARRLDFAKGQWTTVDPLADKSPWQSPYAYCGADPVNKTDFDGRKFVWVDGSGSSEAYKTIMNLRSQSTLFDAIYSYLDNLIEVIEISVNDKDVQESLKETSKCYGDDGKGYYDKELKRIVYSETKADIGTYAEEMFHAFQYHFYGLDARGFHELEPEADLINIFATVEASSEIKGRQGIFEGLDKMITLGISLPQVLYYFDDSNLLIPCHSEKMNSYFRYLKDFESNHSLSSSIYHGVQRFLSPRAYNFFIKRIK